MLTLTLLSSLVLSSCSSGPTSTYRTPASISFEKSSFMEDLDHEIRFEKFHKVIDQALTERKNAIQFYNMVKDKDHLTSEELELIHQTSVRYMRIRNKLLNLVSEYKWVSNENVELSFSTDAPSSQITEELNWFRDIFEEADKLVHLNPNEKKGAKQIIGIKMSLIAALTLYDNYIVAIAPYQENGQLRRLVNFDNIEQEDTLKEISGNFRKLENYKRTLKTVEFVEELLQWEKENKNNDFVKHSDNQYTNLLITSSYTYGQIQSISMTDRVGFRLKRFRTILRDFFVKAGEETTNEASKLFGNSAGLIQFREGKLKYITDSHEEEIINQMKPLDILLEKTPFRLTDKFIPGHWGHVAVWVGNEEQLKELGVWQKLPAYTRYIRKYNNYKGPALRDTIRSGHHIVEALRPGVQINTLRHFLDIDDMAVLRGEFSLIKTQRYLERAFKQIGKEYDFNFDVETDKKIVCSELAFVVYDDKTWPVAKQVGRYAISPDNVAEVAKGDAKAFLEPVLLYHDGKKIESDLQKNSNHLLNLEYDQIIK